MSPNTLKAVMTAANDESLRVALVGLQRAVRSEFLGSLEGNVRVDKS